MKILFIYPNLGGPIGFNVGISILSAVLKSRSHETKLLHLNELMDFPLDFERIKKAILDYGPNLIGFSVNTNQFKIGIAIATYIKNKIDRRIPIVFGGIHATIAPEEVLTYDCVDMAILGEGEMAMLELAGKLEKNEEISEIKNLWLKKNGRIVKNHLGPFISLKQSPFIDTEIWDYQKMIDLRNGWIDILLSRGCPHSCSYCFNHSYKAIYAKYSDNRVHSYLREGDYSSCLEGLHLIIKKYARVKCINFIDDDFLLHPSSLKFTTFLHEEIRLPFAINSHIESIQPKKLKILHENGCDLIRCGIECGNERIRKLVLNKLLPNSSIVEKIARVKEHGLRILTYNMIGLPTEKKDDVFETLKLNALCEPDVVKMSTFFPYPRTRIFSICREQGLISPEQHVPFTFYEGTILNFDEGMKLVLAKIRKFFDVYLNYFSKDLEPFYQNLIKKIEALTKNEMEDDEVQKSLEEEIHRLSATLSSKKIKHYTIKYGPCFAFRE